MSHIKGAIIDSPTRVAQADRDEAIVERDIRKALADQYQAAIREQNLATDALARQKREAEARGKQAMDLAAANGRRFDDVLARTKGAKAATCAEAMPVVNDILEAIR